MVLACSVFPRIDDRSIHAMERMAILQLRAMRGWNKAETARHFFVTDDTIRAWLRRVDDDSLVQTQTPVNRFPDFVRYAVQQIKLFCPTLGKGEDRRHVGQGGHPHRQDDRRANSEREACRAPGPTTDETGKQCRIVSKYPGHTWHADLTAVPISGGFWTNWIPNAIWQRWPVCWWVLNVIDHFSRRSMGFAVFKCRPTSEEVTAALDSIMVAEKVSPKHLIVDQGPEFKCEHFEDVWCKAKNILPRFGAVKRHGSIAVVERFHRTMKELLRQIVVPEDQSQFEREMESLIDWYNEHRPHMTLNGKTPNEVHFSRPPANEQPRIETRETGHVNRPVQNRKSTFDGMPGDPVIIEIDCHEGRRHLPVIRARHAA